jgi:archaeal preflagellin peptidase FlaK
VASPLDVLRLLIGTAYLLAAARLDLRVRRVPNGLWIHLGGLGALLMGVDLFITHELEWLHVAIAALLAAVAYLLWRMRLLAGGADAKAIMALAVLAPASAAWSLGATSWPWLPSLLPAALVAFITASLVMSLFPLGFIVANLARGHVHWPAMALGYRLPLEEARRRFVWIVERIDDEGRLRHRLMPSRLDAQALEEQARRLEAHGITDVWVTPKVPFMVPLLVGWVAAYTVGDVLTALLAAILR